MVIKQKAITKAKARYEAQGYSVTTDKHDLTATKGIHKIFEVYHDNGQKVCILNFKNGKKDGEQLWWSDNGTPFARELWKNGKYVITVGCRENHPVELINKSYLFLEIDNILKN